MQKSEFKGRPTYKIKRKTSFKYPTYNDERFFPLARSISSSVNNEEQLSILDKSIVSILCSEFKSPGVN